MTVVATIVADMKQIYSRDAVYGHGLEEILDGITAEKAASKPLPGAHSIWELVFHISAWENVFHRRLDGEFVEEPEEGDFPPVRETTPKAWQAAVAELFAKHGKFVEKASSLPDSALDNPISGRPYNARFMLNMAMRHVVYHSGQISMLKK